MKETDEKGVINLLITTHELQIIAYFCKVLARPKLETRVIII